MESSLTPDQRARKLEKEYSIYNLLVVFLIILQLVCDIIIPITLKTPVLIAPISAVFFMFSFLVSDILTDNFGFERAVKATFFSCVAQVIFCVILGLAIYVLPTDFHGEQHRQAYLYIFSFVNIIVVSSIISSLASKALNDYLMSKMRDFYFNIHFIWRSIISTVIGETLMLNIAYNITFFGRYSFLHIQGMILSSMAIKFVGAVILAVPGYMISKWLSRHIELLKPETKPRRYNYWAALGRAVTLR
ncbi:VUT family protein [Vibrio sp. S4M6]|uniref:VUT family protein n=1 Tax=Vibrio sinus TaxID=2946865 RepID=UPI00202A1148|nr:VUT family protein [Vibrio sinus]MCL9780642.1 VUT family protein [Vibrio sinus]